MAAFAQQSGFEQLLQRVGGVEELQTSLEPLEQKFRVLKCIKEIGKDGYGHIAEGIVCVLGNDQERPAGSFIRGSAHTPSVSKGFVDESVAYRALNLGPPPFSTEIISSFSEFVAIDENFARFQDILHGNSSDGSWIRATADPLVFQKLSQERGHIYHSSNISKADFVRHIVDSLLEYVAKRPRRRRYVETTVLCKDHPDYSPHFKALRMGLPRPQVEAKMRRALNVNAAYLDTPDLPIVIRSALEEGDLVYTSSELPHEYIID